MNETNHPARRLRHGDRPTEPLTFADDAANKAGTLCRDDGACQYAIDRGAGGNGSCPDGLCCMPRTPAANKAAEEGGLPALPTPVAYRFPKSGNDNGYYFDESLLGEEDRFKHLWEPVFTKSQLHEAIAADRASRQVANKAEVEQDKIDAERYRWLRNDPPLTLCVRRLANNGASEYLDGVVLDAAINVAMRLATPPATTGASTARDQALEEAALICEGVNNHDNPMTANDCADAIRALKGSVGASTVLTDERIEELEAALEACMNREIELEHRIHVLDHMLSGAAQAGQVAVPGWLPIESAPRDGSLILLGRAEDEVEDRNGESVPGRWHEEDHDGPDNMGHDAGFMDDSYQGTFFCGRSFGSKDYQNKGYQPTHWMPLPPSPAKESK